MKRTDVIEFFGSQAKVARFLNMSPPAVKQWGDDVPELRQYELEVKTGGGLVSDWTLNERFGKTKVKAVPGE